MTMAACKSFRSNQASQWLELLRDEIGWPVVYDSVDEKVFGAELEFFNLGNLRLVTHRMSPLVLSRSVTTDTERLFSVNFITRGRVKLLHYDRQSTVTAGDVVLADSQEPSRLIFEEPTSIVTVGIPHEMLIPYVPSPDRLCNVVIGPRQWYSKVLRATLLSLTEMARENVAAEVQERSTRVLLNILSLSYFANCERDHHSRGLPGEQRLIQIREYINENYTDADLTPEKIASHFGLSTRYLRKLFARNGDSLSRYILEKRLEGSANRLTSPVWRHQSITDICYDCGFKSTPHFTRAFKTRFGVTPKEYRKHAASQVQP